MSPSYQDKLSRATSKLRRKLFDYKVGVTGTSTQVIRIKTDINKYTMDRELTLVNHEIIPFSIKLPDSLPLTRLRRLNSSNDVEEEAIVQNVYLYDVLPIEGYSKFSDNVERGDIVIKKIYPDEDDDGYDNPYLLTLQITETLGNVDQDHIVWKKHYCAPYTTALPESILNIIKEFEEDDFV